MKLFSYLIVFALFPAMSYAEEAAKENLHVIPWKFVGTQVFNLAVLAGVIIYFTRKTVAAHFENRLKVYSDLVQKAERAKEEAERHHREISEKLKELQLNADRTIETARKEAEELRVQMVDEATRLASKMDAEAQITAKLEVQKAKAELSSELLNQALQKAQDGLKKSLGHTDQKRLQDEFVEKIQVVRG